MLNTEKTEFRNIIRALSFEVQSARPTIIKINFLCQWHLRQQTALLYLCFLSPVLLTMNSNVSCIIQSSLHKKQKTTRRTSVTVRNQNVLMHKLKTNRVLPHQIVGTFKNLKRHMMKFQLNESVYNVTNRGKEQRKQAQQ